MNKMITLVLEVVVTFFCFCHGELDSLHQNNLKKINIQTSKDILLYILDEVEKITNIQKISSLECETNINQTMLSCTRCEENRCQSTPPQIHEPMIKGLLYEVNKPITKAAKFGQNVGQLVNNLDRKLNSWSEDITWKFNGWLKQAEKHANNVKNGIVDTGKKIKTGAENACKKVWGGIKSIFGKRSSRHVDKRCEQGCPQCDRLDTKRNKPDKVILSICGSNFVSKQKKIATKLKDLRALYSFILSKNSIVLMVEYEKKSVLFTGGKVEFKTSFVTFQNGKRRQRFKLPGMFVISDINGMSLKISQEVFRRMF